MSAGAGLGSKAGAPPAPGGDITIGPAPPPATQTPSPNAQLLAALGGLFQQAGQGLGQQLGMMGQQNGTGVDQATLPDYLRAPYEAGGQYGSPIQQAMSQYLKTRA